ncbi:MAG: hypothetical protein AAFV25_21965, partial [Bacteroidota bacterium]
MPKKQSEYIVRFQIKTGVDEAICRHPKFAKKKLEQLGTFYPRKTITVIISGTKLDKPKRFSFPGDDWESYLDMV